MMQSEWRDPAPRRRTVVLWLSGVLCGVAIMAALGTVLFVQRAPTHSSLAHSATKTPATSPLHLPAPTGNIPPLDERFTLNPPTPGATPCPAVTPPPGNVGPPPVTGTAVPPASRLSAQATLPPCGDGQLPGPRCHTVLPGTPPTQDEVRQALYDAAVQNHFSFSLIEAISWQESGWQQNVKACDGGVGLMQLMPDTTTWLNMYYGRNDDPYTLEGNITQGIELLQWTYDYYIGFCNPQLPTGQTCDWDTVWPGATDGATIRDIVASAYNEGIGTMANYGIINWWYVNSVVNLWKQFLAAEG